MNKNIKFSLLLILLIFCGGCGKHIYSNTNTTKNIVSTTMEFKMLSDPMISSENKNYILYTDDETDSYFSYYCIMGNDESIIDEAGFENLPIPNFTVISDRVLEISKGFGASTSYSKYFDVENNLCSDWFLNVLLADEKFIVYLEEGINSNRRLIIRDPFDETKFYKEFVDLSFSNSIIPVIEVERINADEIRLIYQYGEDYEEREVILSLH